MKRLLALTLLTALALTAQADTFTFKPNDGQGNTADIFDLDHHNAYTWGITGSSVTSLRTSVLSGGQIITGAKLTIWNIWDWTVEANDILNINLLNDPKTGLTTIVDNPNDVELVNDAANNYFGSTGWLTSWEDKKGGDTSDKTFDFIYNFTGANLNLLTSYLTDTTGSGKAIFGLGFDPDCHYYNDGVELTIYTSPNRVPDGGTTLGLIGLGLLALAAVRRSSRA